MEKLTIINANEEFEFKKLRETVNDLLLATQVDLSDKDHPVINMNSAKLLKILYELILSQPHEHINEVKSEGKTSMLEISSPVGPYKVYDTRDIKVVSNNSFINKEVLKKINGDA